MQRLVLDPKPGTTFKIEAEFPNDGVRCEAKRRRPLRARYAGKLEIIRTGDGSLAMINHLTFKQYLEGLAEVPRSWPMESLKAQVIAARTYALYHWERRGTKTLGYDLCSTDACQVYRGLGVSEGAFGDAWKKAVTDTAGMVLQYERRTIEAFYFSTSWGRTVSNADGFGGTPLPYLKPTTGEDDDAPLARWHVEIPLTDLTRILTVRGDWSGGAITSAEVRGDRLSVSDGRSSSSISLTRFRISMNNEAPCSFPDRYPARRPSGDRYPQTILSPKFTVALNSGKLIVDGRGWGHGVGMAQFGARSLAERGRTANEILAHFYGGLLPVQVPEPGAIRILLTEEARRVHVEADGAFTATSRGSGLGPGRRFEVRGGRTLEILRAGSITPVLSLDPLAPQIQRQIPGGRVAVSYHLPTPAKVRVIVLDADRERTRGDVESQTSGPNQAAITLVDQTGTSLSPGLYRVTVEATDGVDTVRAQPVLVSVQLQPSPRSRSIKRPAPEPASSSWPVPVAATAALVAGLGLGWALRRRRRRA